MITEEKIGKLISDSLKMLMSLEILDLDKEKARELTSSTKNILRKLVVAKILYGRRIIAVSGEQGSGKSTLMRNLYGLDEGILSIREGRGEKVPVLISEHGDSENIDEVQFMAYQLDYQNLSEQMYAISGVTISKDEFSTLSEGTDKNVMLLELRVPHKFFDDSSTAFILLPGFEKPTEYWQSLIDFSVACSNSSIMVYSVSMLAGEKSTKIAKRIGTLLGETKPIFAVSFSENQDEQAKNEVVNNSIKQFAVPEQEKDRIVFVTNQSKVQNENWIMQLMNSCNKYILGALETDKNQRIYILKTVQEELREILYQLRTLTDKIAIDNAADVTSETLLKEFDMESNNKLKQLKRLFKQELISAQEDSNKVINDRYEKVSSERESFGTRLRKFVFGPTASDCIETEDFLKKAMTDNKNNSRVAIAFEKTLDSISVDICKTVQNSIGAAQKPSAFKSLAAPASEYLGDESKDNTMQKVVLINNALQVMKEGTGTETLTQIDAKNMKSLAITIHSLAAYVFAKQVAMQIETNMSALVSETRAEQTFDTSMLTDAAQNSKKVFYGALAMFGVDFLPDQQINIIPELAEVFGVSTATMSWIFGGVSVAVLAQNTVKKINRREVQELLRMRTVVANNYREAMDTCVDQYEQYIGQVRNRLIMYLQKVHGYGAKDVVNMNMHIYLTKVEENLYEIQRELEQRSDEFISDIF